MNVQSPFRPGSEVAFRNVAESYRRFKRVLSCRLRQLDISPAPYFDEPSTAYFREQLDRAKTYLEYGSGGSTVLANRRVNMLVSVDSDRHFLAAVGRKLRADGESGERAHSGAAVRKLIYVNIGLTMDWGMPAYTGRTARRVRRWANYPAAPWRYLQSINQHPDLVLVDGRFRAACVLESLLNLQPMSGWQILVDDYAGRPHYHVVERFCDMRLVGRMAVLRPQRSFDASDCRRLLENYRLDPR